MATHTPFSQADLLSRTVTDPLTRNGICVALCDYWLAMLKRSPDEAPADRLAQLERYLPLAMQHQRTYSQDRARLGRSPARHQAGASVGLQYADQTMLMRLHIGLNGIREVLRRDLSKPGAAATWSLRFSGGGGHALAGFCGLSGHAPVYQFRLHVFDPNYGELVGTLQEMDAMLQTLFDAFPLYRTTLHVHRTSEGIPAV